jgi:hypothetical protein
MRSVARTNKFRRRFARPGALVVRLSVVPSIIVALPASPILRRVGQPPAARGSVTNCTCPDIFELADGNFAVIGTDRTAELKGQLPSDAGVAPYERIVVISRPTLMAAVNDLA